MTNACKHELKIFNKKYIQSPETRFNWPKKNLFDKSLTTPYALFHTSHIHMNFDFRLMGNELVVFLSNLMIDRIRNVFRHIRTGIYARESNMKTWIGLQLIDGHFSEIVTENDFEFLKFVSNNVG